MRRANPKIDWVKGLVQSGSTRTTAPSVAKPSSIAPSTTGSQSGANWQPQRLGPNQSTGPRSFRYPSPKSSRQRSMRSPSPQRSTRHQSAARSQTVTQHRNVGRSLSDSRHQSVGQSPNIVWAQFGGGGQNVGSPQAGGGRQTSAWRNALGRLVGRPGSPVSDSQSRRGRRSSRANRSSSRSGSHGSIGSERNLNFPRNFNLVVNGKRVDGPTDFRDCLPGNFNFHIHGNDNGRKWGYSG